MKTALNGPAIGLLMAGGCGIGWGLFELALGVMGLAKSLGDELGLPADLPWHLKLAASPAMPVVIGLVALAGNAFIVFGGLQLRQGRRYRLCLAAAGLCCLPFCFHGCCSIFATPLGLWALMVLLSEPGRTQFSP
ncbi:MAG: hypothetical protein ABTQ32_25085 [Myxococcaceae bacterium]